MKKNKGLAYAALLIIFILFNVIAFVVPTAKTSTFWIAYVFTAVAFVLQIVIWKFAFKGPATLKSKFLGIPLVSVGSVYLLAQLIAFSVFWIVPTASDWIVIVVCTLILGISLIYLIGTEVARDDINCVDEKVEKKVFYIRALQIDVEMLADAENDRDIKNALRKLAEKIRYSDPMSNEDLETIEIIITNKIAELKNADNKSKTIDELNLLLDKRKLVCKMKK